MMNFYLHHGHFLCGNLLHFNFLNDNLPLLPFKFINFGLCVDSFLCMNPYGELLIGNHFVLKLDPDCYQVQCSLFNPRLLIAVVNKSHFNSYYILHSLHYWSQHSLPSFKYIPHTRSFTRLKPIQNLLFVLPSLLPKATLKIIFRLLYIPFPILWILPTLICSFHLLPIV